MSELIASRELTFCEVHELPTSTRVFACFCGPLPLGALTVCEREGTVELVFVQDNARRLGLATKLLAVARVATGFTLDRDTGERSPDGQAWAQQLGIARGENCKQLSSREAEAIGSRLMCYLYGPLQTTELPSPETARQTPWKTATTRRLPKS